MKKSCLSIMISLTIAVAFMMVIGSAKAIQSFADSPCKHDLVKTEAKEATDTANGNLEYWTCSKCGNFFDNENGNEIRKNSWIIPAGNAKGKYTADEIESAELIPISDTPYELLEEDDGYWSGGENNRVFIYCFYWNHFNDGDVLKLHLSDDSTVEYEFTESYYSSDYSSFINKDDDSDAISRYSYSLWYEEGCFVSEKTTQPVGDTFDYHFEYKGAPFSTSVTIIENPVSSIRYETYDGNPIQIQENNPYLGRFETDSNGQEYFFYEPNIHHVGDKLIVNYRDGKTKEFIYKSSDNCHGGYFESDDGENIEDKRDRLDWSAGADNQYGSHWYVGNTYRFEFVYNRRFAEASVTIVPASGEYYNPNQSHQLFKTDAKEATDTVNGNLEYWTCSKCGKYFYDQDGWEEMSQFSWIIPAKNAFGKYEAGEIASVELIPINTSPYELLEEDDGYYTTDENGDTFFSYAFSWRMFETGDILRISLKNGSSVDYINVDGDYSCFVNTDDSSDIISFYSTNKYNENCPFEIIDDKTARVPGEIFDYIFSYKGNSFSTQVYIKENPVESVEFETYDNEPIQILENDQNDGYWETDENGYEFFFYQNWPHNDGDKLTINYKDGTKTVFRFSSVENTFISETTGEAIIEYPFETGYRGLDYQSDQYGYHCWLAGNEYTANIGYYRKWAEVRVVIVPVYQEGEYRLFPTQITQDLEVGETAEIIPEIRTASDDPSKQYEVIDDNITYTWSYDQNDVEIIEDATGGTPKYIISRKTYNRTALTLTASWGGTNTATWTYDLDGYYCGHSLVKTNAVSATCKKEGNIAYWRCEYCGMYFSDENANTAIDESDIVIPKTGHTFTEWETNIAATESADGQQTRTCSICGVKETKIIPKLTSSTTAVSSPSEIMDIPSVKISKPTAAKKKITVKWKKVSKKNLKKISGIEIQVATDPGFTNIVKTATAGKKKTSKKIGGLQSKTKYYVRIRAYAAGNHVSGWKSKSVKVK